MKLVALLAGLLISLYGLSQNSITVTSPLKKDSLGITVKGEELRNFSTNNFLEAVNGMFPWIFSQQPNPNDYLFVVDGFLLQDINAISLQDIDEVRFSINSNAGQYFPFNKSGVFLISTQKAVKSKGQFRFNIQSGVTLNQHASYNVSPLYNVLSFDRKKAIDKTIIPSASYSIKYKRINLYTSLQYKYIQPPTSLENINYTSNGGIFYYADTINKYSSQQNISYLLNINYDISQTLKFRIKANYCYSNNKTDSIYNNKSSSFYGQRHNEIKSSNNYFNIGSSLIWKPFSRLTNDLSFEYSNTKTDYINNYYSNFTYTYTNPYLYNSNVTANFDYTLKIISNKINYEVFNNHPFKVSALVDINFSALKATAAQYATNSNSYTFVGSFFSEQKLTTLNPQINWSLGNILFGKIGYPFILNDYKKSISNESQKNPYAEIGIDLAKLFKINPKASALNFNFNYSDLAIGYQPNYLVYNPNNTFVVFSDYFSRQSNMNYTNDLLKNKTYSFNLNYQGEGKKTQVGASYVIMTKDNKRLSTIVLAGQSYNYVIVDEQIISKGLSVYVDQVIIQKKDLKWKFRTNVLFPKIEVKASEIFLNPIYQYQPDNYTLQCGIQNKLSIRQFYIQANIIAGINRQYSELVSPSIRETKKMNEIGLNFLQVGYNLSNLSNHFFNKININLMAKNLLLTNAYNDYYKLNKFLGISVDYNF